MKRTDTEPRNIKLVVKAKGSILKDQSLGDSKNVSEFQQSLNRKLMHDNSLSKAGQIASERTPVKILQIGSTQADNRTINFVNNKLF